MFLTSDTHFYHPRVINFAKRPFDNVLQMNDYIITMWNQTIKPRDVVWHLGDFTFGKDNELNEEIFKKLNGRQKNLIIGNHDLKGNTKMLGWDRVTYYQVQKFNKVKVILFHYPILEWDGYFNGSVHAHGHQHNHERVQGERRYDVGVDANGFIPVHIEELI